MWKQTLILRRYICREIYICLLGIVGILMLVLFVGQISQLLKEAARGNMTISVVWQIAFLELFPILTYVLPLGFYLSILIVIGRLYRDSELVVMTACGLSLLQQCLIVGGLALGVSCFAGFLSLYVNPQTVNTFKTLKDNSRANFHLSTLSPHRVKSLGNGAIVYVTDVNHRHNTVKHIFLVQKKVDGQSVEWDITNAKQGYQKNIYKGISPYMILRDGSRYIVNNHSLKLTHDQFKQFGFNLESLAEQSNHQHKKKIHISGISTPDLMRMRHNKDALAELQLRISIPLAVLISSILAVCVSEVNPRRASSLYLVPSIALFAIYMILIYLCKGWIGDGKLPPWIGVWWVHVLMMIITIVCLCWRARWIQRWCYARSKHAHS